MKVEELEVCYTLGGDIPEGAFRIEGVFGWWIKAADEDIELGEAQYHSKHGWVVQC